MYAVPQLVRVNWKKIGRFVSVFCHIQSKFSCLESGTNIDHHLTYKVCMYVCASKVTIIAPPVSDNLLVVKICTGRNYLQRQITNLYYY
jgi:hypothetical protein